MPITFECEGCGKAYTVRDGLAGQTGQCKQCGHRMTIPDSPDPGPDGLEILDTRPGPSPAPSPIPGWAAPPRPLATPAPNKTTLGGIGRLLGVVVVLLVVGSRLYLYWIRAHARNARNAQANPMAPADPGAVAPPFGGMIVDRSGPIGLPDFPDPGPGREVEPGVTLHKIVFVPPLAPTPGFSGKLWLYLPSGDHPARSLPCILIAGAGSNLLTGMDLGDGDRPEHLPYARSGFAVLAFELDGAAPKGPDPPDLAMGAAMVRFLNARAGLVNAHVALEYALAKVPQVDPSRISAAGHSSAGTLAVLFAEHEPRLRACVAFAPALDVAGEVGPEAASQLRAAGVGDLVDRYSPLADEAKLAVPLFLFHARDDANVPVAGSESFAARMKARGQSVTLELVPDGGHYDPMIRLGIPRAIEWLDKQGAGPGQ